MVYANKVVGTACAKAAGDNPGGRRPAASLRRFSPRSSAFVTCGRAESVVGGSCDWLDERTAHDYCGEMNIQLNTLRALHQHGYRMSVFCRPCARHVFLDLPALVATGIGERAVVGLSIRCVRCGRACFHGRTGSSVAAAVGRDRALDGVDAGVQAFGARELALGRSDLSGIAQAHDGLQRLTAVSQGPHLLIEKGDGIDSVGLSCAVGGGSALRPSEGDPKCALERRGGFPSRDRRRRCQDPFDVGQEEEQVRGVEPMTDAGRGLMRRAREGQAAPGGASARLGADEMELVAVRAGIADVTEKFHFGRCCNGRYLVHALCRDGVRRNHQHAAQLLDGRGDSQV